MPCHNMRLSAPARRRPREVARLQGNAHSELAVVPDLWHAGQIGLRTLLSAHLTFSQRFFVASDTEYGCMSGGLERSLAEERRLGNRCRVLRANPCRHLGFARGLPALMLAIFNWKNTMVVSSNSQTANPQGLMPNLKTDISNSTAFAYFLRGVPYHPPRGPRSSSPTTVSCLLSSPTYRPEYFQRLSSRSV